MKPDLFENRIKIREQILKRNFDNETLILNLDNENYYGLDAIGTRFLELLTDSETMQQAYDVLLKEYEVDAETLRNDLTKLVHLLERNGIIEII